MQVLNGKQILKKLKVIRFLQEEMGVTKIRFPEGCGIGIKPVSKEGTQRLVRKAIQFAIDNDKPSVTLVHKGNIMKYTEGAFKEWGYELALDRFGGELIDGGPWVKIKNPKNGKDIIIKDVIADAFLQQILMRPADYSVIATLNLNGDYISDALAAEVGESGLRQVRILVELLQCMKQRMALHLNMLGKIKSTRVQLFSLLK